MASKGWSWPPPHKIELRGRSEARIHAFTEAKYFWTVVTAGEGAFSYLLTATSPFTPNAGLPIAMVSGRNGELHVLVDHPFSIHTYSSDHSTFFVTSLGEGSVLLKISMPPFLNANSCLCRRLHAFLLPFNDESQVGVSSSLRSPCGTRLCSSHKMRRFILTSWFFAPTRDLSSLAQRVNPDRHQQKGSHATQYSSPW